ncbi:MAG: DUF1501 domain-containing protein [Gammaproteobacteria bacterium]|nr:DUF1501 domain-containing protein [Gammaproteobacteria bacterium]
MSGLKVASHPSIPSNRDILVCIFQRGAADGLNSLVPYGDLNYTELRDNISVPPQDIIDIDGFYGLHPALAPLKPIYDAGDLCFVHATGMPHENRSHFAAQDLVERGVDSKEGLPSSGWLDRYLSLKPAETGSSFRAISISGNVPVALQGSSGALAISNLGEFNFEQEIIDLGYPDVLSKLYRSVIPFSGPAQDALLALEELQQIDLLDNTSYPEGPLGDKLRQTGQLIKSSLPVEVVCLDSDGWDHHERLPEFINASLDELAQGLSAFYTDMGTEMSRITVLVYTEFGRRLAKNASQGVDHGTAGLAYLMGGGVNGFIQDVKSGIFSDWPGLPTLLDIQTLRDQDPFIEDLKITTDLRSVLSEMLVKRLATDPNDLSVIFPGFNGSITTDIFSSD